MRAEAAAELSDADLVAASLQGDESGWDRLVARHSPLVWAVARRAGLSEDDAADVFQNTWTVAVEELSRLRDSSRFGPWIARVARHQGLRIRRRYGIARTAHERIAEEPPTAPMPEEELSRIEDRSRVARALGEIGERCGELLRALYYQQPTPAYAAIAARLGMRIGSIGPTRARCLEKLQRKLGSEDR